MASGKIFFVIFLLYLSRVESASLLERSYEYVMNFGKTVAPSLLSFLDCFGEEDAWGCTKEKAGRLLDKWEGEVDKQRRAWQKLADESAYTQNGTCSGSGVCTASGATGASGARGASGATPGSPPSAASGGSGATPGSPAIAASGGSGATPGSPAIAASGGSGATPGSPASAASGRLFTGGQKAGKAGSGAAVELLTVVPPNAGKAGSGFGGSGTFGAEPRSGGSGTFGADGGVVRSGSRTLLKSRGFAAVIAGAGHPPPSQLGKEVEEYLTSLADIVQHGVARALSSRGHHEESTVNLAISTSGDKKKKKKKTKPPKIHLIPVKMEKEKKGDDRGFSAKAQTWSIGEKFNETNARKGRGIMGDLWAVGEKGIDSLAENVLEKEQLEDGVENKDIGEMRGKKKKKKKAILKLLILGAVLKAKIGTLLQILSFKLQVKFFLIALVGLGINLARFWLDIKKQHQPPQKVIYYEHAQHQHHYDHEDEHTGGWGPWSRSLDPEQQETDDAEIDFDVNIPYHAQNRNSYSRPLMAQALHART